MRWLLLLVPVVILVELFMPDQVLLIFLCAVLALIPLAAMMGESTEHLASHVGPSAGGLLNATFGNLSELIIMVSLLSKGLYDVVLAGLFGGILANSILASGLAMFLGGLRHHVQKYARENTRDQSTLLTIAVFALLVVSIIEGDMTDEARIESAMSLYVSVFMLAGYVLYLIYTMVTHRDLFATETEEEESSWSVSRSAGVLAGITLAVVYISELLSTAIERLVAEIGISELFVGAVVIAIIGAAAEIASAIRAARRDRMDLAFAISMGGSVQIALFVAPVLVMASYFVGPHSFQIYFSYESVLVLFFCVMISMQLARDGRSTWFKGILLILVYLILAGGIYLATV